MKIGPGGAFLLSFAIGFLIGFVFVGFSLGFFSFLVPPQVLLLGQIAVGLVFGLVLGFLGLGLFFIWRALGRNGQFVLIALIFVAGLLTIQPEIDGLALVGLMFTALGVGKGRSR